MKLNKYLSRLETIAEDLDELIGELEEKRDAIEDNAIDHDRDMTDREQERYDALDEEIENVRQCIDEIESAQYYLEDYCS